MHAKRTGWNIRPRPKTVILKIKFNSVQFNSILLRSGSCQIFSPVSRVKSAGRRSVSVDPKSFFVLSVFFPFLPFLFFFFFFLSILYFLSFFFPPFLLFCVVPPRLKTKQWEKGRKLVTERDQFLSRPQKTIASRPTVFSRALYLLTYAHRSRWSIGHQRPLAIALCTGCSGHSGPVGPLLFQRALYSHRKHV